MVSGVRGYDSDKVKVFAFFEADDSFFPFGGAAFIGTTAAFDFSGLVEGANPDNLLSQKVFHRLADFKFVGLRMHFDHNFVVLLIEHRCFFRYVDLLNHMVKIFHGAYWGKGLGGAGGEGFDGIFDEEHRIGVKQFFDVHAFHGNELCPWDVARGEVGGIVK